MATAERTSGGGYDLETVVAQLYIAFGTGIGSLFVSPEAIVAGRRQYETLVGHNLEKWPQTSMQALEYARTLGRVSALLTISEGRNTITADNYRQASELVKHSSHAMICPFLNA